MNPHERLRNFRLYYVNSPQKSGVVMFASCTKLTDERREAGRSVGSAVGVLRDSFALSEHYIEGSHLLQRTVQKHQRDSEATHIREVSWSALNVVSTT